MGKNQHVVPADGRWGIKGEGNSRLTSKAVNLIPGVGGALASELTMIKDTSANVIIEMVDRLDNINKEKILANLVIARGDNDI